MSFEEAYKKYNNIIHYLLKSYQITYNYDEFYQQMLIKMWQLTLDFDEQQSPSFKSYLFIRLKFYLIDLFRQKDTTLNICSIDALAELSPSISINEIDLLIKDISQQLLPRERDWLTLYLQGYKQYEIPQILDFSPTTIKKIKSNAIRKLRRYLNSSTKD
ncbi:sigma-70 family RNA polymerase sigma factor [Staphylococcus epidermidis]|uniref:sigma-70 family RNA polymerase sigma factor n=1 Tax=Staphylococcus epidermidis TaxID=1282 RepID=UPI00124C5726|nr:sigma-70 family RNA polymerase sigma factor [Staphylococcus epidermidis]KAB2282162.1 sigma-70 family RNA polymerase sigma factor [Staphylococcus epidermidis]